GHGRQVQTADLLAVIGGGKGDVGNDLVDMNADPFMHCSAVLVEFLHQPGLVGAAGKGALQQGIELGAVFDGYFLDFHGVGTLSHPPKRLMTLSRYSGNSSSS